MSFSIVPKSCLQDVKVIIKALQLQPNKFYTISSHYQDAKANQFFSYAHFIANSQGVINVSKHESIGGNYTGVFQMGLIAALQPVKKESKLRIFKRDVEIPNKIDFWLHEGHKSAQEIFEFEHQCITKESHYRHFMGPGVKRYPVRSGNVRATLFIPAGRGPFPAIVDMFGTAGGLLEYRSAQLATRGIASLALAFFNYEDLPKGLSHFKLSYFDEAVQYLLSRKEVLGHNVGVIGVSKGGDLAISMATFLPAVSLAISINGFITSLGSATEISEAYSIPKMPYDMKYAKVNDDSSVVFKDAYHSPELYPECIIPMERSDSQFFFVVGEDDQNLPSEMVASVAERRMKAAGKGENCHVRVYKGAGHLIEPPYSPFCKVSYHRALGFDLVWGGDMKSHMRAQEESWVEMITFIKKHLGKQTAKL